MAAQTEHSVVPPSPSIIGLVWLLLPLLVCFGHFSKVGAVAQQTFAASSVADDQSPPVGHNHILAPLQSTFWNMWNFTEVPNLGRALSSKRELLWYCRVAQFYSWKFKQALGRVDPFQICVLQIAAHWNIDKSSSPCTGRLVLKTTPGWQIICTCLILLHCVF